MPLQGPAAPPPLDPNTAASNSESAVTHKAEPPAPSPGPSPLGKAEKLCPCPQRELSAPRVPRLRAVVESQAFRNILVDEMDMMMSRAATLIQASWRRHQLRQKLVSQVTAARAIQEAWRRLSTRRLRRLGHAPLKKAKVEDDNIPYHPPAQVRFQQLEDKEPPALPAKVSKETQFPSADILPPCTPSQDAPSAGDPSITFLPHQTVTIKLVGPGAPEASFQPCVLTRTIHSSGLGSQGMKVDEAPIRASKAGSTAPAAVSQRAAIKTQAHATEGPQRAAPQTPEVAKTTPGTTATKIPPQLYPPTYPPTGRILAQPRAASTLTRPAPPMYPPAAVTVTRMPSQMFPPPPSPSTTAKPPLLPSGLTNVLGRPTCTPPPSRSPLQSCLAALMNRGSPPMGTPEPAAQTAKSPMQMRSTAPMSNTPAQSRAPTTKGPPPVTLFHSSLRPPPGPSPAPAKTPAPTVPVPGMGRARPLLQPPTTVTKASLHTCRTVTITKTPSQTAPAPSLPKTTPQTRLAAMITKTPAQLRSVAAVLRTLCTPPAAASTSQAKTMPPPPTATPAGPSSHLSLSITKTKTTAVNTRHVAGLLKVPSQPTLPDGPVRCVPPQSAAGRVKTVVPARGPLETDKAKVLPPKQGKAERTPAPMAQGMPWGTRAHPGPGKVQSQVVLQPTPVTPFLQPKAGGHPLTQLGKGLSQRPSSHALAQSSLATHLSQGKTPPQGHLSAPPTKTLSQTQLPVDSGRGPFTLPQATSKLSSKPQSPPLLTSSKASPQKPAGRPTYNVDSGDSQAARGPPTSAAQSQEDLAASQVAALCAELASMLASQEDLRVLLAKGLPQGDTRTALGQALSKEVLATSVGRALPQGMLGLALLRALSWTELGSALSRALSRGELRTELTKTMQGQLADVLSKALTEEERAALGQALCQGELGAVLSQTLLRTGLVLPKANLKPASGGIAPRAPVEVDFRGLPGSWGPTVGPGIPQQSKVRGLWPEAWGGCVSAWPVGFLSEMGDGLLVLGSACSPVVSGGPCFLGRGLPSLGPTLEAYFISLPSLRAQQETIRPLLGAPDLLFHLIPWAGVLAPQRPAGPLIPLPASLWPPLHANGVGPSSGQPSLPPSPSQASQKSPVVVRGGPQRWESSGVGRGAVDRASRSTRGCGRDMHPHAVTYRGPTCRCQFLGVRQVDPGACRCPGSKQSPAGGRPGTQQRSGAASAKPGSTGCMEARDVAPNTRQATRYCKVPLAPVRPKTGDKCLSLMASPLTPCHRRAFNARMEPSRSLAAPPTVIALPSAFTAPTSLSEGALEPLSLPQHGAASKGPRESQTTPLLSDLVASANSSGEDLLTRTLFMDSSQNLVPRASSFSLSAASVDSVTVADEEQEGSLNRGGGQDEAEKEGRGLGESPSFRSVSELIPALARNPASSRVTFKLHWRPQNHRGLGEASDLNPLSWDQAPLPGCKEGLKRSRSLGSVHVPPTTPQLGACAGKPRLQDLGALKGSAPFDKSQSPVVTPILSELVTSTQEDLNSSQPVQEGGENASPKQATQTPALGSPGRQRHPLDSPPEHPPVIYQVLPGTGYLADEGAPRQSCPPQVEEASPGQSQTSVTSGVATAQSPKTITVAPNVAQTPARVPAPTSPTASGQDPPCGQPQGPPEAQPGRPFIVQITYSHPYPRCTRSRAQDLSCSSTAASQAPGAPQSSKLDRVVFRPQQPPKRPGDPQGNSASAPFPYAPSASAGWDGASQGADTGGLPKPPFRFHGLGAASATRGPVASGPSQSVAQGPMSACGSRGQSVLPPGAEAPQASEEAAQPPPRPHQSFTWGLLSHKLTISPSTYPRTHAGPCSPSLSPEASNLSPPGILHPLGHSPTSAAEPGPGGQLWGSLLRNIGQHVPFSPPQPPPEPQACTEEQREGPAPGPAAPSLPQSLAIGLSPRPFPRSTGSKGAVAPFQVPCASGLLPLLATSVLRATEQLTPGAGELVLDTQGSQVTNPSLGTYKPAAPEPDPPVYPSPLVSDMQYSAGCLPQHLASVQGQRPRLEEVDAKSAKLKGSGPARLPPRSPCVPKHPTQTGNTAPSSQPSPATTWGAFGPCAVPADSVPAVPKKCIQGPGAPMAPPSPAARQTTHTVSMAPQNPSACRYLPMDSVASQSPSFQSFFHQYEPMDPVAPWSPSFHQQLPVSPVDPQSPSFHQQVPVSPVDPQSPSFHQQVPVSPVDPQSPSFHQQVPVSPVDPQSPSFHQQVPMGPVAPWSPSFHQMSMTSVASQRHEQASVAPVCPLIPSFHQQVNLAPQSSTAHQVTLTAPVVPWGPSAYRQRSMAPQGPSALQQEAMSPVTPKVHQGLQQASVVPMICKDHSALQPLPVAPKAPSAFQQLPMAPVVPKVHSGLQQVPMTPEVCQGLQQTPVAPKAPSAFQQLPMAPVVPKVHSGLQQVPMVPMTPEVHQGLQQTPVAPKAPSAPSALQQVPMAPVVPKVHSGLQQVPMAPEVHGSIQQKPVAPKSPSTLQQVPVAPVAPKVHSGLHQAPVASMTPKVHRGLQKTPVSPGAKAPSAPQQVCVAPMTPKICRVLQKTPVAPGAPKAPSAPQQVSVAPMTPKICRVLQKTPVAPVAKAPVAKAPAAPQQVSVAPMTPKICRVLQKTPVAPVAKAPVAKAPAAPQQVSVGPMTPKVCRTLQKTPVAPGAPKAPSAIQQVPVAPMTPDVRPTLQQTPVAPEAPSAVQQVSLAPMTPEAHQALQQTPVAPMVPKVRSILHQTSTAPVVPKVHPACQQVPMFHVDPQAHADLQQAPVDPQAHSMLQQAPVDPQAHSMLQQVPVDPQTHSMLQQVPVDPQTHSMLQQAPVDPQTHSMLQQVPVDPQTLSMFQQAPVDPQTHSMFQQAPVDPQTHSMFQQAPVDPQTLSMFQQSPVAQVEPYNHSHRIVDSCGILGSQGLTHGCLVASNLPPGSVAGMVAPGLSCGPGTSRSTGPMTAAARSRSAGVKKCCRFSDQEAPAHSVPPTAAQRVHRGLVSAPLGSGHPCGPAGGSGKYLTPAVLQGAEDPGVAGGSAWNSASTDRAAGPPHVTWEPAPGTGRWAVGSAAAADPRRSGELPASVQVMEKLILRAVITLQAGTRGYLVRKTIKVWHQWAVIIQAAWRGYCVRRDLARLARAAVVIQAAWRGFSFRQSRTPSALSQAPWPEAIGISPRVSEHRCFQSCQPNICHLCQSLTTGLGSTPSVVMLVGSSPRTCHTCGQAAPTRVVHGLGQGSRDHSSKQPLRREAAATRIQAIWKGFRVRQLLLQRRTAAQKLQATWRGHSTRTALSSDTLLGLNRWQGTHNDHWQGF